MSVEGAELILPDGKVAQKFIPINASGNVIESGGGGATVATVDNIVMLDSDGTLFFKRVTGDTPPILTNWKLSDGTAYTVMGSPVPYVVTTTNITGNVEITNDIGNDIPVKLIPRVCTGTQLITALSAGTAISLTIPALSVSAEIQADGGVVRVRKDSGIPTATTGWRIDDGMSLIVDSTLTDVKLIAQSGSTTNVQIVYFDRV